LQRINGARASRPGDGPEPGRPADGLHLFTLAGLLRNSASPNLPGDYLKAIDRLRPNPNVGTCAAAAATGCVVITPDFHADEKWAELRHLPLALGFVSAWSMPIKSSNGYVLGTFGTYFRESRQPTKNELEAVQRLAVAAARTLEPAVC